MKVLVKIGVLAVLMTASLSLAAQAAEFKRIKKKADLYSMVVDKKLVASWGWAMLGSDGTVSGLVNGAKVSGTWKWKGGYYCRELMIGDKAEPNNCQTVHISGSDVVFIRDKGKGRQSPMKIK